MKMQFIHGEILTKSVIITVILIIRGFHKCTTLEIMPKLVSESSLCENKILPQSVLNHWPRFPSLSCSLTPSRHLLLLNFCSCTAWFLDLVRINQAWLYKDPKGLTLQASAQLGQKGACWTWKTGPVVARNFYFHVVKVLMAILALCQFRLVRENPDYAKSST